MSFLSALITGMSGPVLVTGTPTLTHRHTLTPGFDPEQRSAPTFPQALAHHWERRLGMHACMHTYTQTHTPHTPKHTHTNTHTYTPKHTHIHANSHTHRVDGLTDGQQEWISVSR